MWFRSGNNIKRRIDTSNIKGIAKIIFRKEIMVNT